MPPSPDCYFLGISGCPTSGKSTLSYLLTLIYPNTILLHADDFAEADESKIPLLPDLNVPDADSIYGVDFQKMLSTLAHIKTQGILPVDYHSWFQTEITSITDGQRRAVKSLGGEEALEKLTKLFHSHLKHPPVQRLVILDGFLLYHNPDVRKSLDKMIFLRMSKATAKSRRLAKPGWGDEAKPDMFWATAPYFEASVWKNYVQEHAWMFKNGDVEDNALETVGGLVASPTIDGALMETAEWAATLVASALNQRLPITQQS